ncbi:MAG: TIGR03663 family protein [Chloroflexi bacterium]|nr:TIGR03663 family protein [Chloroflexota bacterium]
MTEADTSITGGRGAAADRSVGLSSRISVTWEVAAYAVVLISALGLRLWDLGSRALHHDEALHAVYANDLFTGSGYEHTPLLHGPLQIFGTAFAYFVSGGPSDVSARILPALIGTGLVVVPLLFRSRLGRTGALATAALLAFSPTLLYFSRFARNDIWIAFFTLVLIVAIWRFVSERQHRFLYVIAGTLALSFAVKENTFIIVGTLLLFLNLWVASDLAHQTQHHHGEPERLRPFYTLAYVPFAWLITALWPFIGGIRERLGLAERLPAMDLLLVVGTLSGPQFAAAIEIPFEAAGVSIETAANHRLLGFPTVIALLAASAIVGLRWNPRVWLAAALLFYVPYTVLFTALFTDMAGFGSGIWESLDYWLGQHDARRAGQPDFYYLMLLPAYEMLALVIAGPALLYYTLRGGLTSWALTATSVLLLLAFFGADSFEPGGLVEAIAVAALPFAAVTTFFAVRGSMFERFLVFWTASAIVAYSFFGEKFPWLSVHTTLPMIVLAGYTVGKLASQLGKPPERLTQPRWPSILQTTRRWATPALLAVVLDPRRRWQARLEAYLLKKPFRVQAAFRGHGGQ